MEKSIKSTLIGELIFNVDCAAYQQNTGKIQWQLDMMDEDVTIDEMIKRAEKLFICIEEFDKKAKAAIAKKLIDFKNDFWPEYDENDEFLNWDVVDAGEYDVTTAEFEKAITLYNITIRAHDIYCEYFDGDLFGGHRIHAYFDYNYLLLSADI